ncbi:M23 family metallopeptidase [Cellulomonas cellasea]|uniref:M23 family metallopeptidase n=1 Tax=Cellulomonas cellasea TaxID=43670 RepID=UPI0025A31A66|nr:M23 family metallopeptidase [Cellulomonas cellasea]MDM8083550.1 M23 family metallopeptidase [Cellulomonas cellasea]
MTSLTSGITSAIAVLALAGALAYGAVSVGPGPVDEGGASSAAAGGLPPDGSAVDEGHAGGQGDTSRAAAGAGYVAPTATLTVLRPFERPPATWAAGHRGVDLAAGAGEAVRAPADGTVSFAGLVVDRPVLSIVHTDGRRSSLEPVASDLSPGSAVRQGDTVGHVESGSAHCPPVSCVHWGVREGEAYLDPLTLLSGGGPVVLLPGGEDVRRAPTP